MSVAAMMLCSCQEYDYGLSVADIEESVKQREYKEAFRQEFTTIDPGHTWMCVPDTMRGMFVTPTRGGLEVPVWVKTDSVYRMSRDEVRGALAYMEEARTNTDRATVDFEFIAVEETTYDIMPTFWGRKFVDTNRVGIYYVDASGQKVDLGVFWSDADGTYQMGYEDQTQSVGKTTNELTDIQMKIGKNGNRSVTPQYYLAPHFSLTVPAGIRWGLYLITKKQQSGSAEVTWYSNSQYNPNAEKAAASFSWGGVSYVSFEDAPHDCSHGQTGNCGYCGYGHYDKDYNDIVLAISPRPIESTYRAISYRVMCEDLGGTFDWDFNDVVFDVVYEDRKGVENATLKIRLQAVGGTLPVYIHYGEFTSKELHSYMGVPDTIPVNVIRQHNECQPVDIFTYKFGFETGTIDIRDYVKDILVTVNQRNGATTMVTFPREGGDHIPQCFMTSVGTDWSDELVNIKQTYPQFEAWAASQQAAERWWETDYDF